MAFRQDFTSFSPEYKVSPALIFRGIGFLVAALLLLAIPHYAHAQYTDISETAGTTVQTGHADYSDVSSLGRSPEDITNQLVEDDEVKDPLISTPGIDRFMVPWYEFKKRVNQQHGLQFGISYNAMYQNADASKTDQDEAASGVFDIFGTWTLLGRKSGRTGVLGFRLVDQHTLGTPIPTGDFSGELGSGWGTALAFGEGSFIDNELWWEQTFVKDRIAVRAGKVDVSSLFNPMTLGSPFEGFTSHPFNLNSSIAFPSEGLGAVVHVQPWKNILLTAGIHDANGNGRDYNFDKFFNDKEHLKLLEVAWTPEFSFGNGDYHVTLWEADKRVEANVPGGDGYTLAAEQTFGNVLAFFRYGHSSGGAAGLKNMVAGGFGLLNMFGRKNDVLGIGASWGDPFDPAQRDQHGGEIYYRLQLTNNVAVTPHVQFIFDPTDNLAEDRITLFGVRVRKEM
jgi:porin